MFYDCPDLPTGDDDPEPVECCTCGKLIQHDEPAVSIGVDFDCVECYTESQNDHVLIREVA